LRVVSIASLEQALAWEPRAAATAPGVSLISAAFRDGLRSTADKAPIRWPADLADDDSSDEQRRRAALIAGHLVRDRLRAGASLPEPVFLAAIGYAAALATPQAQRILTTTLDTRELLRAHTYACVLSERHGHEIDEAEERRLFTWLLDQADLTPTTELDRRMLSQRARRRQRLRG
jgi:hypothetical protein